MCNKLNAEKKTRNSMNFKAGFSHHLLKMYKIIHSQAFRDFLFLSTSLEDMWFLNDKLIQISIL